MSSHRQSIVSHSSSANSVNCSREFPSLSGQWYRSISWRIIMRLSIKECCMHYVLQDANSSGAIYSRLATDANRDANSSEAFCISISQFM
nr:hypothetical protein [Tanacetum cinerariifolium]